MSVTTDPALYKSSYKRNKLDQYWTEREVTRALVNNLPRCVSGKILWEPAAGRGDMARVFKNAGWKVFASDIDTSKYDTKIGPIEKVDFTADPMMLPGFYTKNKISLLASNPPFGDAAEQFVRVAVSFVSIRSVAMLLRSEWNHASGRLDLFDERNRTDTMPFAREIVLTWRPRWDWWLTPKQKAAAKIAAGKKASDPDQSPRHNFSWFIWSWDHKGPSDQVWASRAH